MYARTNCCVVYGPSRKSAHTRLCYQSCSNQPSITIAIAAAAAAAAILTLDSFLLRSRRDHCHSPYRFARSYRKVELVLLLFFLFTANP